VTDDAAITYLSLSPGTYEPNKQTVEQKDPNTFYKTKKYIPFFNYTYCETRFSICDRVYIIHPYATPPAARSTKKWLKR